jgi:hypothetical protein
MSETKNIPLRWRREPSERGLSRIAQGVRGWELRRGEDVIIRVAAVGLTKANGWYWYGMGRNTCASPVKTPEEAKQQANSWARSNR